MPFLLSNGGKTVSALRMLPFPTPNPNPKFISTMITSHTLAPSSSPLSNPNPRPPLPQINGIHRLQTSASRSINRVRELSNRSSSSIEALGSLDDSTLVVVSFYRFADFPDHVQMRKPLKELCERVRVSGGIILAPEGINGSICGTRESVEKVLEFIQADERLRGLRLVESPVSPEEEAIHHGQTSHSPLGVGEDAPFRWDHVRVKVKKEIVSFGDPRMMPTERVGKYVRPKDWNALISDPDIVYHLEGGILKYLEEVPKKESLWEGECFVFDKRVSVDHGLVQGSFNLCYGCKQPVSDDDMESP